MASRKSFETFYQGYGQFLTWLAIFAGFALFGMMLLVDANAFMRWLFNEPVTGTLEITEALMPVVVLLSMGFTQYVRGHIRVTLGTKHLSPEMQRTLFAVTMGLGFLFMAWFTWAAAGYALRSFQIDEHAWGSVRFPIYPSKMAVAVGTALLSIQFLLDAIRAGFFKIDDAADGHEASEGSF